MLELFLCSIVTILPDYLYRRFAQGKRFGQHINIFTVWHELRYGITLCLLLTLTLITVIFYYHPATTSATLYYRSIPIFTEKRGRVDEVFVGLRGHVEKGDTIFTLDSSKERAERDTAQRRIEEIDAEIQSSVHELAAAEARVRQAEGALAEGTAEMETRQSLQQRGSSAVSDREVERVQNRVTSLRGALDAAKSDVEKQRTRKDVVLPSERARAMAELREAEVAIEKTIIVAPESGRLEQFVLRKGDLLTPLARSAGVLIPDDTGRKLVAASFGQIGANVLKPGLLAEITCPALPLTIIPMVVSDVQPVIGSGQIQNSNALIETTSPENGGAVIAYLTPLHEGGLDALPPGASCIANAYTNNHERIASGEVTGMEAIWLHAVDSLAIAHAFLLRLQALAMPAKLLVLTGH